MLLLDELAIFTHEVGNVGFQYFCIGQIVPLASVCEFVIRVTKTVNDFVTRVVTWKTASTVALVRFFGTFYTINFVRIVLINETVVNFLHVGFSFTHAPCNDLCRHID